MFNYQFVKCDHRYYKKKKKKKKKKDEAFSENNQLQPIFAKRSIIEVSQGSEYAFEAHNFGIGLGWNRFINSLSASPTKWSNTLKQSVGKS